MSRKIYGRPIATPINPDKFASKGVVKTVNGINPDENGNVELETGSESLIVTILWNDSENRGTASHSPAEVYAATNSGIPVVVNCYNSSNRQFLGQFVVIDSTQSSYRLSLLYGNMRVTLTVKSDKTVTKNDCLFLGSPFGAKKGQILAVSALDDYDLVEGLVAVDMPTLESLGGVSHEHIPEVINDALAQAKDSGDFDGEPGKAGYNPVRGTDYWTPEDIAEIKSYVDEAILGGAW